jgi:hypothetical protein
VYPPKRSALTEATKKTPSLCTSALEAVSAPLGDDVVSATTHVILRPSIPPAALTCLKRASIAAAESSNVEAAGPVRSLIMPTLTVLLVTPGAPALAADEAVVPLRANRADVTNAMTPARVHSRANDGFQCTTDVPIIPPDIPPHHRKLRERVALGSPEIGATSRPPGAQATLSPRPMHRGEAGGALHWTVQSMFDRRASECDTRRHAALASRPLELGVTG